MRNSVNILGIQFSKLTLGDTINLIDSKVSEANSKTFHIITVNPEIAVQIQEDPELRKISLEADLITPDGVGIVMASKLRRNPVPERVTGYDLLLQSLELGNRKGWSFYFFGSEESVNKRMAEHIAENYPDVVIAGRHNGYFDKTEEESIIEDIERTKPDVLIVALGSPLADKWIYKYKDRIPAKVTFGVGGSLDVITGKVRPTPDIWRKMKLEWLFRRIIMPSRKERQKKLKIFVYKVLDEVLKGNKLKIKLSGSKKFASGRKRMKTVRNIEKKIRAEIEKTGKHPFYSMNYCGDYGYDEYLKNGVPNLDEFCSFANERLIIDREVNINRRNFGCAAFAARNTEGDAIFAQNMDCEYAIPMMIRLGEGSNYKSVAFLNMAELDWDENTYDTLETDAKLTLAAPYSPHDGINEHGLAVACMTNASAVYPKSTNKITLFDETLTRLLLDKAKSVDEAIEYMKNFNLFFSVAPLHYMVADAAGDAAVIEFVDGKMVTVKKNGNYQVATNFTLFNNPTCEGFGKDRYENIENQLDRCGGIITENEALELLKRNVIPGDEQWSSVYNLAKRRVLVTFSREYDNVYEFEL